MHTCKEEYCYCNCIKTCINCKKKALLLTYFILLCYQEVDDSSNKPQEPEETTQQTESLPEIGDLDITLKKKKKKKKKRIEDMEGEGDGEGDGMKDDGKFFFILFFLFIMCVCLSIAYRYWILQKLELRCKWLFIYFNCVIDAILNCMSKLLFFPYWKEGYCVIACLIGTWVKRNYFS